MYTEYRFVAGAFSWLALVTIFFNGEEIPYVAEVCEATVPENQARAQFERLGGLNKALAIFLREVRLEVMH